MNANLMKLGMVALLLGLASCGGGTNSSNAPAPGSTAPTISAMSAIPANSGTTGIIAAPTAQRLTIYGTNFVSGTTITISNGASHYATSAATVTSSTTLTADVTIPSVPADSYVTIMLYAPNGDSTSGILGVAHAYKTLVQDIQPIFDKNLCYACHGTAGGLNLSNASASSTALIEAPSSVCVQKLRVKAGDPRQASNVLIDVLKHKTNPAVLSCNSNQSRQMPQGTYPALSAAEIEAITDWIALGAN
jgi:hypothetical protein